MTSFTWDFYTRSILSDDPFENGRQKTFLRDAKYIFEEARLIKERSPVAYVVHQTPQSSRAGCKFEDH